MLPRDDLPGRNFCTARIMPEDSLSDSHDSCVFQSQPQHSPSGASSNMNRPWRHPFPATGSSPPVPSPPVPRASSTLPLVPHPASQAFIPGSVPLSVSMGHLPTASSSALVPTQGGISSSAAENQSSTVVYFDEFSQLSSAMQARLVATVRNAAGIATPTPSLETYFAALPPAWTQVELGRREELTQQAFNH